MLLKYIINLDFRISTKENTMGFMLQFLTFTTCATFALGQQYYYGKGLMVLG